MVTHTTTEPRKKDLALAAIMERIARDGRPPSLRQLGRDLGGISVTRVRQLLGQLEADGAIERERGVQLSIRIRDVAQCRTGLTEVLRLLGFRDPARPFTHEQLPMLPSLEHSPEINWPGASS